MAVRSGYLEWVLDQLGELGPVTSRRMFGGAGLFHDGVMFGLVDDDVAYFKVGEANRLDYVERGMSAFQPAPGELSTTWFEVPPDVLEEPDELAEWARKSIIAAAAPRSRTAPKRARQRTS